MKIVLRHEPAASTNDGAGESPSAVPAPPGKIFGDSLGIYDDEARIALDYFKRAAEKIIAEEDRINGLKEEAESRLGTLKAALAKNNTGKLVSILLTIGVAIAFAVAGAFPGMLLAVVPLCFFFSNLAKASKNSEGIAKEEAEIQDLDNQFAAIKRDYRIDKMGVVYVPVATSIPFEDKSFVLDDTEVVGGQDFSLYQMNDQEEFLSTLNDIRAEKDVLPLVEGDQAPEDIQTKQMSESLETVKMHDYIGSLDRNLRSASYLLNDLKKTSVSLPVVDPKTKYAAFLHDFCTEDATGYPTFNVFSQRKYETELARFHELNQLRKRMAEENAKLEKMLQEFIADISAHVQLMSRTKLTSVNKLVDFSNGLLLNSFKASFNHYSSLLESSEIKRIQEEDFDFKSGESDNKPFNLSPASRVAFDPISGNWVADDGSRTSFPFGIHQIQEEVIAPLVQNLLMETRTERMRIYNEIMDQKRDYLNQWHRDTDDFYGRGRAESSEIINQMQTTLAEINTAVSQYKAYEDTEKNMTNAGVGDLDSAKIKLSSTGTAFSIAYCEQQTSQIRKQQDEFNDYIVRLNEDIDRRASEFGYTRFYDALLRDGHAKEVAMALLSAGTLEDRRKSLLGANAYIAANAKLPPEPEIESSVFEALGTDLNQLVATTLAGLEASAAIPETDADDIGDEAGKPDNEDSDNGEDDNPDDEEESEDGEDPVAIADDDSVEDEDEVEGDDEEDDEEDEDGDEDEEDEDEDEEDEDEDEEDEDGDEEDEDGDEEDEDEDEEDEDGDEDEEDEDGDEEDEDEDEEDEDEDEEDVFDDQGGEIGENDIVFDCPHCGHTLVIDRQGAGILINCVKCGKQVIVPEE